MRVTVVSIVEVYKAMTISVNIIITVSNNNLIYEHVLYKVSFKASFVIIFIKYVHIRKSFNMI